jgi:hypothetical protein
MCVLWFSSQVLFETCRILRRIVRNIAINCITVHAKNRYCWQILFDLNFIDRFSKNTQITTFMKILPMGYELFHEGGRTDRRADMTKPIVAFYNFATRLKHFVDLFEFAYFGVWCYLFSVSLLCFI